MLTVADVLSPEFNRSWHEAVAIVLEVSNQLGRGDAVPRAGDLVFGEDGALTFGFSNEDGQSPVSGLATLLQDLLNGIDAPGGLLDLARENATETPAHATVEGFARALEFYERPGRTNDIAAVAGRLRSRTDLLHAEREFERLREKVGGDEAERKIEEKPKPEAPKPEVNVAAVRRRRLAMALSGALFLIVLVAASAAGRARVASAGASATGAIRGAFQSILSSSAAEASLNAEAGGTARGPAEAPLRDGARSAATTTRTAPAGKGTRAPGKPAAASPAERSAAPSSLPAVEWSVADTASAAFETRAMRPLEPLPVSAPTLAIAPPRAPTPGEISGIYSIADPDVQAPRMVRPALPKEPEPDSQTGYFDLVIDEAGNVERVKLISPTRRYREWMLLAAAKAWQFQPAKRHGKPVKYMLRVPIILPIWQASQR